MNSPDVSEKISDFEIRQFAIEKSQEFKLVANGIMRGPAVARLRDIDGEIGSDGPTILETIMSDMAEYIDPAMSQPVDITSAPYVLDIVPEDLSQLGIDSNGEPMSVEAKTRMIRFSSLLSKRDLLLAQIDFPILYTDENGETHTENVTILSLQDTPDSLKPELR